MQHGRNTDHIITAYDAWRKSPFEDMNFQRALINHIYDVRTANFPKDAKRYAEERTRALNALQQEQAARGSSLPGRKVPDTFRGP